VRLWSEKHNIIPLVQKRTIQIWSAPYPPKWLVRGMKWGMRGIAQGGVRRCAGDSRIQQDACSSAGSGYSSREIDACAGAQEMWLIGGLGLHNEPPPSSL